MAMGTATLDTPPMFTTRDDAADAARSDGSSALIWKIPEELSGDAPAYRTLAVALPMVTATCRVSDGDGVVRGQNEPSTPPGLVGPPPVPQMVMKSPGLAGFDGEL